jgi:hypothetical protein
MARSLGATLPEPIRPLLNGEDIASRQGVTFLVLTTTPEGWPHLAMVSVGELLALGGDRLRLALWLQSTAVTNLTRTGRTTLALVHGGAGYYVRCAARRVEDLPSGRAGRLAQFELEVEEAFEDIAPYAELTSGITFRLKNPPEVLPAWQETIAALRRAAASDPCCHPEPARDLGPR